jgi:N-acetylneuraminic acid mutarotase
MKYLIFALRTGFLSLALALVASCGGGGGGSSTGTAPVISNLTVTPPAAYVSATTLNFDAAFDFADADGNVASFTMRTLDSRGLTTDLQTQAIQGISGVTAGTIFVQLMATSVPADTYTVEIYITDAVGQRSNTLSRTVRIAEFPWVSKLASPTLREYAASVAYGGKVYVMGGQLPHTGVTPGPATNVMEIYDPATNTWTAGPSMPTARMGLVAAVANNKIYAIGGQTDSFSTSAVATVEEFNPATNAWIARFPMSVPRYFAGGATLPTALGDRIVVAGGESLTNVLATVEEYNPVANSWVGRNPLPVPRSQLAMAESGGRLYAVGGYAGLTTQWVATVEEFDPGTSQWTARANMLTARSQIALVTVNGKLLAAGGGNVNPSLNVLESYDPVTNTWTTKTPSTSAFTRATASVVNGKMYVFGDGITLEYNPANEIY